MKSCIIGGAPRAGKSLLAKRLQKETGLSLISNDYLVSAMEGIFPELDIRHGEAHRARTSEQVFPFMKAYLWLHSDWGRQDFILDTTHLTPAQLAESGMSKKYKTVFLGYPRLAPAEKLSLTRRHAAPSGDWTNNVGDEELLKTLAELIALGKTLEQQCREHDIPFFDTSENFETALDEAYKYLTAV